MDNKEEEAHADILNSLSDSPFDILSLIDTKYAVQTCVLAKRYKDMWKSLLSLNFDSESFKLVASFDRFVRRVLSNRNRSNLYSLSYYRRGCDDSQPLKRVLNHAIEFNVRCMKIATNYFDPFPLEIFKSQSLKTMHLSGDIFIKMPLSLEFLAALHLENVSFEMACRYGEAIFSSSSLKTLNLIECRMLRLQLLCPQLENLTIKIVHYRYLNDFEAERCTKIKDFEVVLDTPKLVYFNYDGDKPLSIYRHNLPSLGVIKIISRTEIRIKDEDTERVFL